MVVGLNFFLWNRIKLLTFTEEEIFDVVLILH